jgi:hypothetical protein
MWWRVFVQYLVRNWMNRRRRGSTLVYPPPPLSLSLSSSLFSPLSFPLFFFGSTSGQRRRFVSHFPFLSPCIQTALSALQQQRSFWFSSGCHHHHNLTGLGFFLADEIDEYMSGMNTNITKRRDAERSTDSLPLPLPLYHPLSLYIYISLTHTHTHIPVSVSPSSSSVIALQSFRHKRKQFISVSTRT